MDSQAKVDEHLLATQFDDPSIDDADKEPAPVLGLNLREYF